MPESLSFPSPQMKKSETLVTSGSPYVKNESELFNDSTGSISVRTRNVRRSFSADHSLTAGEKFVKKRTRSVSPFQEDEQQLIKKLEKKEKFLSLENVLAKEARGCLMRSLSKAKVDQYQLVFEQLFKINDSSTLTLLINDSEDSRCLILDGCHRVTALNRLQSLNRLSAAFLNSTIKVILYKCPGDIFEDVWHKAQDLSYEMQFIKKCQASLTVPSIENATIRGLVSLLYCKEKHRTSGIFSEFEELVYLTSFVQGSFSNRELTEFRSHPKQRFKVMNLLKRTGLISSATGGRLHMLPQSVSLMEPRTQQVFLRLYKSGRLTHGKTHETVLKASIMNDQKCSDVLKRYESDKEMTVGRIQYLLKCVISDIREEALIGVTLKTSLDQIPDESFVVYFKEIGNVNGIKKKNLTCLVIAASQKTVNKISNFRVHMHGSITGTPMGNAKRFIFFLFGGKTQPTLEHGHEVHESIENVFVKHSSAKSLKDIRGKIYCIEKNYESFRVS